MKIKRIIYSIIAVIIAVTFIIPSIFLSTVNASDNSLIKEAQLVDSNGPVSSIPSASTLAFGTTGYVRLSSIATYNESTGAEEYSGYEAAAFSFKTYAGDYFYNFTYINPDFAHDVNFVIYTGDHVYSVIDEGSTTVSQSQSETFTRKLEQNTTYYIVVYINNQSGYETSDVSVCVNAVADDAGDTYLTASSKTIDTNYSYGINGYGDVDYFKFTTSSDSAYYSLDVKNVDMSSITFTLYDNKMSSVDSSTISTGVTYTKYLALDSSSTYYLYIVSANAKDTGNYTFSLNKYIDDFGDSQATATKITKGNAIKGQIQCYLDNDAFYYNSGTDDTVRITLKNNASDDGPDVSAMILDYKGSSAGSITASPGQTIYYDLQKMNEGLNYYIIVSGTDSVSYTLTYSNIKYKITYVLNGGENSSKNPTSYTVGKTTKLYKPKKTGNYYFSGWLDSNGTGPYTSIASDTTGNITLVASWIKVSPMKPKNVKLKKSRRRLIITYDQGNIPTSGEAGVTGYQIQVSKTKKFKKKTTYNVKDIYAYKKTIKGLKKGKKYFVRMRSYYTYEGTKFYSKFTKKMSIKM